MSESKSGQMVQPSGARHEYRPGPGGQRIQPAGTRQAHRAGPLACFAACARAPISTSAFARRTRSRRPKSNAPMAAAAFFARFQPRPGRSVPGQHSDRRGQAAARGPHAIGSSSQAARNQSSTWPITTGCRWTRRHSGCIYLLLLSLITLFILFFATWIARYMAGQISTPITALLRGGRTDPQGKLELSRAGRRHR